MYYTSLFRHSSPVTQPRCGRLSPSIRHDVEQLAQLHVDNFGDEVLTSLLADIYHEVLVEARGDELRKQLPIHSDRLLRLISSQTPA